MISCSESTEWSWTTNVACYNRDNLQMFNANWNHTRKLTVENSFLIQHYPWQR